MTHPSSSNNPGAAGGGLGKGMLIIFWLLLIGLLTWAFGNWEERLSNPNSSPDSRTTNQYREVILDSNRQHHYVANGQINDTEVTFWLDTGATDVVIPANLADKLQLTRQGSSLAMTANGTVRVYGTQLRSLQLGNIELRDIRASINPGMGGKVVLLGMSALRSIEFQHRDGQLILRQPIPPDDTEL